MYQTAPVNSMQSLPSGKCRREWWAVQFQNL